MGSAEENQQERSNNAPGSGDDEILPPYAARPTVDSPFNFPPAPTPGIEYSDLPEAANPGPNYSTLPEAVFPSESGPSNSPSNSNYNYNNKNNASTSTPAFLAIPQIAARPTSPFPAAYNRAVLLRRGVTQEAFTSFLATLSAFLTASVPERALTHAADVGRSLNAVPRQLSRETVAYAKGVGRRAEERARRGNLIGAGVMALAGVVTIPAVAALRVVGAAVHLPAAAAGGLAKKPLSPRERAVAYLAVAQRDWFQQRGLTALLVDTAELVVLLRNARYGGAGSGPGLGPAGDDEAVVRKLVDVVHGTQERGCEEQLRALQGEFGFAPLEITDAKVQFLDIGASTLWLVLTEAPLVW
ncbi:hypothetical protein F5Y12DRAFT_47080 [Xylaria sp. FL1777]|nr:hypothetical protein F5Y12DRAFT_47080 [Xylaria sp. FL1777]